ncbi:hypothetical protein SH528x_003405 [Novipirellula sp. SH528]|uniref:hypothetical protein n=1 Tax=Novipirellula sp. SH528 TaxID=3454466 RepID=UPI003FA0F5C4
MPDRLPHVHKQKKTGRLPILVGVLGGMIGWILLASLESPSFYRLSVLIFDETSPNALFATAGYYCIHRTLLLVMCAIGGGIGISLSSMRMQTAILFLFGILVVVAVFASIFPR